MDAGIIEISRFAVAAARSADETADLLRRVRLASPKASLKDIRLAAIYAMTDPQGLDDDIATRLQGLAAVTR